MLQMKIVLPGILIATICLSSVLSCGNAAENTDAAATTDTVTWMHTRPLQKRDTVPQPVEMIVLPDSNRVYLLDKQSKLLHVKYAKEGDISVDGDMFFEILSIANPIRVHTKLLDMEIAAPSAFRVMADRKEEGEEIQVVFGDIRVKKSYPSDFPEPDTIRNHQLLMINRTIDLMEKEKLDTKHLVDWYESTIKKAAP